jgi:hypothetical protein
MQQSRAILPAMSQDDRDDSGDLDEGLDEDFDEEGPAPTPFDHPLFLPGLLLAFTLWFGYDGWFNPEMKEEFLGFNRWGAGLWAFGTVWFGYKGLKEMREDREQEERGPSDDAARG